MKHALGILLIALPALATAQTVEEERWLPEKIPVFPLQDIMLFPDVPRPLHIFEQRYRDMIEDALEGDRIIGMVMLQPGYESEYLGRPPIYAVGCAGYLESVERLPDGRFNILLRGLLKFRVTAEDDSRSYRLAEVEPLPEALTDADREALSQHRPRLLEALGTMSADTAPTPDQLSDEVLVNGLAQFYKMEPRQRLDLLEKDGLLARAEALIQILRAAGTLADLKPPESAIPMAAGRRRTAP